MHFLLLSERPDRLLPTIRSRCQRVRFAALPNAALDRILDAARRAPRTRGARRSRSAAGRADRALELCQGERALHVLDSALQIDAAVERRDPAELLGLGEQLASADDRALVLESLAAFYRDVAACGLGASSAELSFARSRRGDRDARACARAGSGGASAWRSSPNSARTSNATPIRSSRSTGCCSSSARFDDDVAVATAAADVRRRAARRAGAQPAGARRRGRTPGRRPTERDCRRRSRACSRSRAIASRRVRAAALRALKELRDPSALDCCCSSGSTTPTRSCASWRSWRSARSTTAARARSCGARCAARIPRCAFKPSPAWPRATSAIRPMRVRWRRCCEMPTPRCARTRRAAWAGSAPR